MLMVLFCLTTPKVIVAGVHPSAQGIFERTNIPEYIFFTHVKTVTIVIM